MLFVSGQKMGCVSLTGKKIIIIIYKVWNTTTNDKFKCYHQWQIQIHQAKLSEERRVSLNSCFIPSISGVLIQQTLKRWYICHFLNNYDLNKGRFIVSRSPVRLPRGFCISNQRLFVLSGLRPNLHLHHPLITAASECHQCIFKETHKRNTCLKRKNHTKEKTN